MSIPIFVKDRQVYLNVSRIRETVNKEEREEFLKNYPLIKKSSGSSSLSSWLSKKKDSIGVLTDLIKYCKATGLSPQDLYDLNGNFGDTYSEELLEAFQAECDKAFGEGDSQVFCLTTSIKSFYKYFGKQLTKGRATVHSKRVHEKSDFTKDDLIPFTDNQDAQFKAMTSTLSSVPVRLDAFLKMKWKDVKEIFYDNVDLPFVQIPPEYQKKSIRDLGITQSSFLHSWAKKSLLEWRTRYQELTGRKIDIANPSSLENPLWITKQKPFERPKEGAVERWFRLRSKEYGKRIIPHNFRAFVNTRLRCPQDLKGVFMAQTGTYKGAYIQKGTPLFQQLKNAFLEASNDLNPMSDDKFKEVRGKLRQRLSGYGVPSEEIDELARSMTMGLMQMNQMFEQQQRAFIERFYEETEKKLNIQRERRIEAQPKPKPKLREEEDFPFTKKSWKGTYPKEGEES